MLSLKDNSLMADLCQVSPGWKGSRIKETKARALWLAKLYPNCGDNLIFIPTRVFSHQSYTDPWDPASSLGRMVGENAPNCPEGWWVYSVDLVCLDCKLHAKLARCKHQSLAHYAPIWWESAFLLLGQSSGQHLTFEYFKRIWQQHVISFGVQAAILQLRHFARGQGHQHLAPQANFGGINA